MIGITIDMTGADTTATRARIVTETRIESVKALGPLVSATREMAL